MTKHTKMLQFDKKTIQKIFDRDGGCFFCKQRYWMLNTGSMMYQIQDAMHIVNKSQGGLGIEQNGVQGCRYHHHLMDNGNKGLREEMVAMLEEYIKSLYEDWSVELVTFKKYNF